MFDFHKLSKMTLMMIPLLVLGLSGCTIIGHQIGVAAEKTSTDVWRPDPDFLREIAPGAKLDVRMMDGRRVKGAYLFFSNPDSCLVVQDTDFPSNALTEEFKADIGEQDEPATFEYRLPLDEIGMITVTERKGHGGTIGTIAGAAVDATLITIFAVSMESFSMGP